MRREIYDNTQARNFVHILGGIGVCNDSTEIVSDKDCGFHAELMHKLPEILHHRANFISSLRLVALAIAAEIGCDDRMCRSKDRQDPEPRTGGQRRPVKQQQRTTAPRDFEMNANAVYRASLPTISR